MLVALSVCEKTPPSPGRAITHHVSINSNQQHATCLQNEFNVEDAHLSVLVADKKCMVQMSQGTNALMYLWGTAKEQGKLQSLSYHVDTSDEGQKQVLHMGHCCMDTTG